MLFRSLFKSFLFGVPIGVTFLDSVGYVARVEGISMQPVLNPESQNKDYVFLSRWSVSDYQVNRGDIISLVSPKNPNQMIIKRVVALEGDVVSTLGYKNKYVRVPEGYCWVEGDHTGHTLDSNTFGPVSLGLISAKALYIVWPPDRWQSLEAKLPENRKPISVAV
ncbi:mitochondrial inner membrane protease subunit 2 [Vanessa cardui]|uniref:mitochondrial inner membrane protease subunit 2 n=1 Tax=Vanessa cardui TaxID=171605 RepID=UPI001F12AA08|nr:mitochondrial inner membrane protease subunit 2 [Vanessa cardui]